ncbi:hypothetical protein JCM8547_007233 [Rhodosporidiobolus lusitaniae]
MSSPRSAAMAKSASVDTPTESPARTPRASVFFDKPAAAPASAGAGRRASEPAAALLSASLPPSHSSSSSPTTTRWRNPFSARPSTSAGAPRPFGSTSSTSFSTSTPSPSPAKARNTTRPRPATSSGPLGGFGSASLSSSAPSAAPRPPSTFFASDLNDAFHLARAPTPAHRLQQQQERQERDEKEKDSTTTTALSSSSVRAFSPFARRKSAGASASLGGCVAPVSTSPPATFSPLPSTTLPPLPGATAAATKEENTPSRSRTSSSSHSLPHSHLPDSPSIVRKKPSFSDAAAKAVAMFHLRYSHGNGSFSASFAQGGEDGAGQEEKEELSPPTEDEIASWRLGHMRGSKGSRGSWVEVSEMRGGRKRGSSAGSAGAVRGIRGGSGGSEEEDVLVIQSRPQSRADLVPVVLGAAAVEEKNKGEGGQGKEEEKREKIKSNPPVSAFNRTSAVPLFPSNSPSPSISPSSPSSPFPSSLKLLNGRRRSSARPKTAPTSSTSPFLPFSGSASTSSPVYAAEDDFAFPSPLDAPAAAGLNVLDFIALDSGTAAPIPFRFPQQSPPKAGAFFPAPQVGAAALEMERQRSEDTTSSSSSGGGLSLGSETGMVLEGLENPGVLGQARTSPVVPFSNGRTEGKEDEVVVVVQSSLPVTMQKLFASPSRKSLSTNSSNVKGELASPSSRAAIPQPPPSLAPVLPPSSTTSPTAPIPSGLASFFSSASPISSRTSNRPSTASASLSSSAGKPLSASLSLLTSSTPPRPSSSLSSTSFSPGVIPPPRPPRAATRPRSSSISSASGRPDRPLSSGQGQGQGQAWHPVSVSPVVESAIPLSLASPTSSPPSASRTAQQKPIRPKRSVDRLALSARTSLEEEEHGGENGREGKKDAREKEKGRWTPPPSPPESDPSSSGIRVGGAAA